jgi:hypothetical protein
MNASLIAGNPDRSKSQSRSVNLPYVNLIFLPETECSGYFPDTPTDSFVPFKME